MIVRLKVALCCALIVVAGLVISAACAAMNQPDDVSVAIGFLGMLGTFVFLPWAFLKILRWKGRVNA